MCTNLYCCRTERCDCPALNSSRTCGRKTDIVPEKNANCPVSRGVGYLIRGNTFCTAGGDPTEENYEGQCKGYTGFCACERDPGIQQTQKTESEEDHACCRGRGGRKKSALPKALQEPSRRLRISRYAIIGTGSRPLLLTRIARKSLNAMATMPDCVLSFCRKYGQSTKPKL